MTLQGYILDVPVAAVDLPDIGPVTTSLLQKFVHRELTSAYQVHTDTYHHWDSMSYKNTNKTIHKLRDLGLIKVKKKNQTKHRAIYYKLTPLGIFYMFYKDAVFGLNMADLFSNYETDNLFNYLLYPYFERSTLFSIRSSSVQISIYTYLTASCRLIAQCVENTKSSEKFPGMRPVLHWKKGHEQQYHPEFLSYLECRFELSFSDKNLSLKRVHENKIEIKDIANYISIELNQSKKKASLLRNNKKIFEFDILPATVNQMELDFWDSEGYTTKSNFAQAKNFLLFELEAELLKMILSLIARSQNPLPIKQWQADLQNDLLVLGNDKKFIETLKSITLIYENATSEFLKIASQIQPK